MRSPRIREAPPGIARRRPELSYTPSGITDLKKKNMCLFVVCLCVDLRPARIHPSTSGQRQKTACVIELPPPVLLNQYVQNIKTCVCVCVLCVFVLT